MCEPDSRQILTACLEFDSGRCRATDLADCFGVDALNRFAWSLKPSGMLTRLSADELASLIRAFVLMENEIEWFCRGSTTQVNILLNTLRQCGSELADNLTEWAFVTTKNPYVPFGTYGRMRDVARSASEYIALTAERAAAMDEMERLQQEEARARRDARSRRHAERVELRRTVGAERRSAVEVLALLPPVERLEAVAHAVPRPAYYPGSFVEATSSDLASMPLTTRYALLRKLDRKRKGKWGALRRMLEALPGTDESLPEHQGHGSTKKGKT